MYSLSLPRVLYLKNKMINIYNSIRTHTLSPSCSLSLYISYTDTKTQSHTQISKQLINSAIISVERRPLISAITRTLKALQKKKARCLAPFFHTLLSPDGIFCPFSCSMSLHASLDTSFDRESLNFQTSWLCSCRKSRVRCWHQHHAHDGFEPSD